MAEFGFEGFYAYKPDRAAAIAFAVLFGILIQFSLIETTKATLKNRKLVSAWKSIKLPDDASGLRFFSSASLRWTYSPFILGIVLEFVGYVVRAVSINKPTKSTFIVQSVFLLIAPSLYSASIFMLFSKMAHLLFMERYMVFPAKYNTLFFLVGDMTGRVLQAAGGGLLSSLDNLNTARILIIVGLFIQIFCYSVLMLNQIFFHYKMKTDSNGIVQSNKVWFRFNYILLGGNILIIARSIVRAIEFIMGLQSYIIQHEWCLYVFDTVPMFLLPLIFLVCFRASNVFKLQEESVEAQLSWNFPTQETDKSNSDVEEAVSEV